MAEGLSKKQIKELRKLEKMQSRNLEQKNNTVKWVAIAVISILFLVFFVGVIMVAKDKNKPQTADGSTVFADNGRVRTAGGQNGEEVSTGSAEKATASVTFVEYADLQCPACKQYHPIIKELLAAYPDQVRLVFKHFPLYSIHPNAMDSAIAAEAAHKQNKFFEYVDLLYERQSEWSSLPDPAEKFNEYASELGLDVDRFKKDLDDPGIPQLIEDHRSEGITNGVTGTPTFFVNGERISSPSNLEEFKKIVDQELAGSATQSTEDSPSPTEALDNLKLQQ